jgi:hypothetical protein
MFIRIKEVNGQNYAYHVENRRVHGKVRQKVKGYVGKAHTPDKIHKTSFTDFTNKKLENYSVKNRKSTVHDLVQWELHKHGLTDFTFDKQKNGIIKEKTNMVLKINEGYLYDKTIKDILNFKPVGDDEYFIGKSFAESFVKAGIDIPKELFVNLFEEMTKE